MVSIWLIVHWRSVSDARVNCAESSEKPDLVCKGHGIPAFRLQEVSLEGEFLWTKPMLVSSKKASCAQAGNKILVV